MLITLVKIFNMSKLLLSSLEDYALTVFHFKDVLFNMETRESMFLGNHKLSHTYVIWLVLLIFVIIGKGIMQKPKSLTLRTIEISTSQ